MDPGMRRGAPPVTCALCLASWAGELAGGGVVRVAHLSICSGPAGPPGVVPLFQIQNAVAVCRAIMRWCVRPWASCPAGNGVLSPGSSSVTREVDFDLVPSWVLCGEWVTNL